MEKNEKLLSPCGLYCGVCGIYYATRDNNQRFMDALLSFYQSNLPGLQNMTTDDLACEGCFSDNRALFCETCAVKDCNQKKGYTGCHECDDFPCRLIEDFPIPVSKKVILRSIPYRKKYGTEKWVADEEARYICPDCGNAVFRGVRRCNSCKIELNLD
ncbi:MAG: DUF3795 domain-containing protein [Desulfobacterales bacterium]|jgi:hypothetical protein